MARKKWDQYVREAKIEPFELEVSEDEVLTFEAPSGQALILAGRALRGGDTEALLVALTGEQYGRVYELLADASHLALAELAEDLMDHFKVYDEVVLRPPQGGKTITARRPREVRALLQQGYTLAGEAPAS